MADQKHSPLAFLSVEFKGPQLRWTMYEKEGFAIAEKFHRLDYMLMCELDTRIFTDHRNLLFLFAPSTLEPSLGRHKVLKVLRWAVFLFQFMYRIERVDGEENVMAGVMTRGLRGYRNSNKAVKGVADILQQHDVVPSPSESNFTWSDIHQVRKSQEVHASNRPKKAKSNANGIWAINARTWINNQADELQLRFLIVAHCGSSGHRGSEATADILREEFVWSTMDADARAFVSHCIHCIMAKTGEKTSRPSAPTLLVTKPNKVIHFDLLFMGLSSSGGKYVLVINDDLSSY